MKSLRLVPALALAACTTSPAPMDAPASLAAAETAFAAHSVREDMRVAFLANFADDGVFVRGGWANSNAFQQGRPAPPIVLDWRPQYVEVAAAGDLGLSTGPSRITSKAQPDAAPSYGQFVSVWRRHGAGPWKVAVDLGIFHPQPSLWDAPLVARATPGSPAAAGTLEAAEARFAREARARGARAAYAAHGAADFRFYRAGQAPVADRAAALASPAMDDARTEFRAERFEVARSGDFGYARGSYAAAADPGKPLGWYLRVWRHEPAGWRIVIDVANAAPPAG